MYSPDTILTLKEPRSTEDKPFAYDVVRVIGPSPVDQGHSKAGWVGNEAQGVVIQPMGEEFGANLDEPFGKLQRLYDVTEVPERVVEAPQIRVRESTSTTDSGPTPEDVFKTEAPGKPSVNGERVRTPISPLEDPRPEDETDGPLGRVESVEEGATA